MIVQLKNCTSSPEEYLKLEAQRMKSSFDVASTMLIGNKGAYWCH